MTATTTTTTTTAKQTDTGIKDRSEPLTVSMADLLKAKMQKKPMAGGSGQLPNDYNHNR
jgi:hypothetical protein